MKDGKGTENEHSFIKVSDERVMIDAVKQAQDGEGIILRVYETSAHSGEVTITLPCDRFSVNECNLMEVNENELTVNENSFSFSIKPFEVKTFRIK